MAVDLPPGMPNERELARQNLVLAKSMSDADVAAFLRSGARAKALNGSPLERHTYRLMCGHLMEVHGASLPLSTRTAYCPDESCRVHRDVVEWLTRPDKFRLGQA